MVRKDKIVSMLTIADNVLTILLVIVLSLNIGIYVLNKITLSFLGGA